MNVSRCILVVDTSIFVTSKSEWREYYTCLWTMFVHQTNALLYPSSITYDETVTRVDYVRRHTHLKSAVSSFPHDSQETARLNEDSQRSSLVDDRNSPTPPSQVLALTLQCDMWLHVAYGVYIVMLLIRVNCICLVNTLYLWIWHAFLFLVHTTSFY